MGPITPKTLYNILFYVRGYHCYFCSFERVNDNSNIMEKPLRYTTESIITLWRTTISLSISCRSFGTVVGHFSWPYRRSAVVYFWSLPVCEFFSLCVLGPSRRYSFIQVGEPLHAPFVFLSCRFHLRYSPAAVAINHPVRFHSVGPSTVFWTSSTYRRRLLPRTSVPVCSTRSYIV